MNKWLIIGIVAFVVIIGIVITVVTIKNSKNAQIQANAMAGSGYHTPSKQDNIAAMVVALSGVAVAGVGAYTASHSNSTNTTTT